jgi:hypothetical protein
MRGERVQVTVRQQTGVDPGNDPTFEDVTTLVDNVLVAQGDQGLLNGSTRPDGVVADATMYFPRTFSGSLMKATVTARGRTYRVIGDPIPYDGGLKPTEWNLTVPCKRVEG